MVTISQPQVAAPEKSPRTLDKPAKELSIRAALSHIGENLLTAAFFCGVMWSATWRRWIGVPGRFLRRKQRAKHAGRR